jgi:ABC-type uncharacterized transport system involved in gliding motility auxiliary subunit
MKRYLVIPGALLLVAAVVRATVNVEWGTLDLWLAIAGATIVVMTAVWNRQEVIEWIRDPRGIFAVTTAVAVAAFVAALVMLNIVVWYNPWSIDLTATGRNQVSEDTRRILARLEEPVTLRQFGRAADPRIEQLLRGFERETLRITVEFRDVDRDRALATEYGVIKLGTVVVSSGENFRKVEEPNEQALITAVLQVTSNEDRVVCFVTGHGERGLADEAPGGLGRLSATLEASNYRADRLSLLEGDVPMRCAAVVVAGARQEYTKEEGDRLTAYLDRGGRAALLLEPAPAPAFADLLVPRGIEPVSAVIVDASGAGRSVGGGPRTPLAVAYMNHPITRGFEVATLYDGTRPLRVTEKPPLGGRSTPLAQTSPRSFATVAADGDTEINEGRGDIRGPLTLAAATTIGEVARLDRQSRIAVVGDSDFVSNAFLRRQGNRDFFLRTLAWLLGEEEATVVAVDERENRRIELTQQMLAWMYIVNLGVLPLIPLVAGTIVFIRSRR